MDIRRLVWGAGVRKPFLIAFPCMCVCIFVCVCLYISIGLKGLSLKFQNGSTLIIIYSTAKILPSVKVTKHYTEFIEG